jgi:hypothetical protein
MKTTTTNQPDLYVLLHHLPVSLLNGAVGRVVGRVKPTESYPDLLFVEIVFPRAAQLAHARVQVMLENASVYSSLDKALPEGVTRAQVLSVARRNAELLFEAVALDMLPPDEVSACFGIVRTGCEQTDAFGQVVFGAWLDLIKSATVTVEEVERAQLDGTLPHLFELKARALIQNKGNLYSRSRPVALLLEEPAPLLARIDYDFQILTTISRLAAVPI